MICIQESWLDTSIENVIIPNYSIICCRGRAITENRGGVIAFLRHGTSNLVHWKDSNIAERSWMLLHTDVGSIAIANWYRPGNSEDKHIESLPDELIELKTDVNGFLILGDLNMHHAKWLRYSNGNSRQGTVLKEIYDNFALQ